jgi:hypothetical protein
MRTIEVPGDVYDALKVAESEREAVLERKLAASLYREGILSFGADLALPIVPAVHSNPGRFEC